MRDGVKLYCCHPRSKGAKHEGILADAHSLQRERPDHELVQRASGPRRCGDTTTRRRPSSPEATSAWRRHSRQVRQRRRLRDESPDPWSPEPDAGGRVDRHLRHHRSSGAPSWRTPAGRLRARHLVRRIPCADATVHAHPALKVAVPMNPMVDGWRGDDWFHNGAFRQQNIPYIYEQTATARTMSTGMSSDFDDRRHVHEGRLGRRTLAASVGWIKSASGRRHRASRVRLLQERAGGGQRYSRSSRAGRCRR